METNELKDLYTLLQKEHKCKQDKNVFVMDYMTQNNGIYKFNRIEKSPK